MKHLSKFLLGAVLLTGVELSSSGCASEGYVSTGVYYGPHYRDPWFRDDPWMHRRHRGYRQPRGSTHTDIYISPPPSPPRLPRPPGF